MNLCSHGHEEICYECRKCPLCEAGERITELESKVSELSDEVSKLDAEISNLDPEHDLDPENK